VTTTLVSGLVTIVALAGCGSVGGASPSGTPEGGRSYEVYGSGASTLCDSIGPHRSAGAASPPP
jgi:hypothetical protein